MKPVSPPKHTAGPSFLREQPDGVLLSVKVRPRSSVNAIREPLGDELCVNVTSPPVDAAANETLLRFLAGQLGLRHNRVELIRGHTSRHKLVKIHGATAGEILGALAKSGRRARGTA